MKKLLLAFAIFVSFAVCAHAQNLTTVSASNITDINGTKLAAGQLCFLITDQQDNPISVSIGGGGQALKRGYCSAVAAGVVTSFTVPNPASTSPSGIYYRVTVKDSSTGQEVLRYTLVSFTGTTFNFDNYAPVNLGNFAPLTGNSVSGNLAVSGSVAATGSVTGSNIPGSIPGAGSCTNQFVRTLNTAAPPTCNTVGSLDLAASLSLATPVLGVATGTSVNLGGTGALSTTAQSGTGSLCMTTNCVMTTPNIGAATGTSLSASGTVQGAAINAGATSSFDWYSLTARTTTAPGRRGMTLAADPAGDVTLWFNSAQTGAGYFFKDSATSNIPVKITPNLLSIGGSSSGFTGIQAAAAASGTLTLPAVTDTLVARTTTDTLTNKTLTSPAISDPTITGTTALKRVRANQGSALVVGDVGSLNGFGSTAAVSAVSGTDSAGSITIASSGTGQAVNAQFTLTFHDGAFPSAPIVVVSRADGNNPTGGYAVVFNQTTTTVTIGFAQTPVAGQTYNFNFITVGR